MPMGRYYVLPERTLPQGSLAQQAIEFVSKDKKLAKHEHHANAAEEGDTANIKQNTTNEGYFRGRRES